MGSVSRLAGTAASAVLLVTLSAGSAAGGASPGTGLFIEQWGGTAWAQPPAQTPHGGSSLSAITALSAGNAWAVGSWVKSPLRGGSFWHPLAEHWNGSSWQSLSLPTPKQKTPEPMGLAAVDGSSARNVWAVGTYGADRGRSQRAFFEHWNGRSWRLMPCPHAAKFSPSGVAVASSRAAWAVGFHLGPKSTFRTWILRWNGSSWKRVPSPNPGRFDNLLTGVSAHSARDAWAVGEYRRGRRIYTLVLHWDGARWKQVASPSLGSPYSSSLKSVVAVGARDAWAVGEYAPLRNSERPLVEHWNGRRWNVVPAPATVPTAGFDRLDAVAASSARDVWAVGTSYSSGPQQGFSEHWDGSSWKIVPLPDAPVPGGFGGVAAGSSRAAWAVGTYVTAP